MRQSAGHLGILLLEITAFAVAVGDCILEDGKSEMMEPNVSGKSTWDPLPGYPYQMGVTDCLS